jgi:hypothetical protein
MLRELVPQARAFGQDALALLKNHDTKALGMTMVLMVSYVEFVKVRQVLAAS